jgi:hypothetical protein
VPQDVRDDNVHFVVERLVKDYGGTELGKKVSKQASKKSGASR